MSETKAVVPTTSLPVEICYGGVHQVNLWLISLMHTQRNQSLQPSLLQMKRQVLVFVKTVIELGPKYMRRKQEG